MAKLLTEEEMALRRVLFAEELTAHERAQLRQRRASRAAGFFVLLLVLSPMLLECAGHPVNCHAGLPPQFTKEPGELGRNKNYRASCFSACASAGSVPLYVAWDFDPQLARCVCTAPCTRH